MSAGDSFILFQATMSAEAADAASRIDADCRAFCDAASLQLHRVACAVDGSSVYVYARAPSGKSTGASPGDTARHAADFAKHCTWARGVRASVLELKLDVPGASKGEVAAFHYVVETDPESGWMPEISRWYDDEHMPGLAAVPGCIRAMRFVNHGHGPLSLACYDLVDAQTLGSPPWLAVRATAWSDIARPHFTNTRRTMFRVPSAG